jgi:hypothetical protein
MARHRMRAFIYVSYLFLSSRQVLDRSLNSGLCSCKMPPVHFCSGYFGDGGLKNYLLDWPKTAIFPISASQVARIIGMSHWCWSFTSSYKGYQDSVLGILH